MFVRHIIRTFWVWFWVDFDFLKQIKLPIKLLSGICYEVVVVLVYVVVVVVAVVVAVKMSERRSKSAKFGDTLQSWTL